MKYVPNLRKIKDITRKKLTTFILLLLFIPFFAFITYVIYPGTYLCGVKIKFKAQTSSIKEETESKILLEDSLKNPEIFDEESIAYFAAKLSITELGKNLYQIEANDSRKNRLYENMATLADGLRDNLATIDSAELKREIERLSLAIEKGQEEKENLRNILSSQKGKKINKETLIIRSQIEEFDKKIEPKESQLKIISEGLSKDLTVSKKRLFTKKKVNLTLEINALKEDREKLILDLTEINKSIANTDKSLLTLLDLEKTVDKNTKRLLILSSIKDAGGKIKVPYLYSALILEPPNTPEKIYSSQAIKKRLLLGLLFSLLIILFIYGYYTSINPIISSARELEEATGYPVIGALIEVDKN